MNTEKLNIIYFPSRQHTYNTFTVTSEELFVYKSEVSAINIGFFNKERDFVSLGNTEILLWPWESEQRNILTIIYKHNHNFLQQALSIFKIISWAFQWTSQYVDKKILKKKLSRKNTSRICQMATFTIIFKVLENNLQKYVSQSCKKNVQYCHYLVWNRTNCTL